MVKNISNIAGTYKYKQESDHYYIVWNIQTQAIQDICKLCTVVNHMIVLTGKQTLTESTRYIQI